MFVGKTKQHNKTNELEHNLDPPKFESRDVLRTYI
jgi:hypothetical protein